MWFGVLGAIEACADTPLRLSSRRQRALAGMLVCHRGHFVSVDRLVEANWEDDAEPQRGKAALQTIVSRLRTAISDAGGDPRVIVSDDAGYRIVADAARADAWEFEALIGEGASCLSAGASDLAADAFERRWDCFAARRTTSSRIARGRAPNPLGYTNVGPTPPNCWQLRCSIVVHTASWSRDSRQPSLRTRIARGCSPHS